MSATKLLIQYMKKTAILCALLFITYSCMHNNEDIEPNPVVPSDKQLEYQSMADVINSGLSINADEYRSYLPFNSKENITVFLKSDLHNYRIHLSRCLSHYRFQLWHNCCFQDEPLLPSLSS